MHFPQPLETLFANNLLGGIATVLFSCPVGDHVSSATTRGWVRVDHAIGALDVIWSSMDHPGIWLLSIYVSLYKKWHWVWCVIVFNRVGPTWYTSALSSLDYYSRCCWCHDQHQKRRGLPHHVPHSQGLFGSCLGSSTWHIERSRAFNFKRLGSYTDLWPSISQKLAI